MTKKRNLLIDSAILITFLVAYEVRLTGDAIHEWLSLGLALTLIVHIVLHWDWIIRVGSRYFRKLFHSSRLNFLIDVVLFVSSILLMTSGLMISRSITGTLGIQFDSSMLWRTLHSRSADICMIMAGLHFAMHWKWLADAVNRHVIKPIGGLFSSKKVQPVQAAVTVDDSLVEIERQRS